MKFTFHVTLLTILLFLVFLTVGGLGLVSYWNARATADDLSRQVLEQTAQRIDHQINDLLSTANYLGDLNEQLLNGGEYSVHDFHRLGNFWVQMMRAEEDPQLM